MHLEYKYYQNYNYIITLLIMSDKSTNKTSKNTNNSSNSETKYVDNRKFAKRISSCAFICPYCNNVSIHTSDWYGRVEGSRRCHSCFGDFRIPDNDDSVVGNQG